MADLPMTRYQEQYSYRKMGKNNQENFDILVNHYGKILNEGPKQGITIYTSHNFDRHSSDLYRIISMYLLQERGINQLSEEELYLLNISVLLHDISMCKGGYDNGSATLFNRKIHSLQSAQWIRHEYSQGGSPLSNVNLSSNQIEIICDICQAHSDLKDQEKPSGLKDPDLKFKKDGYSGPIRVKALAGILRIADELDVTRDRLTCPNEIDELLTSAPGDDRPEARQFIQENNESLKHFRRLMLIQSLQRPSDDATAIALKLDDNQVQRRIDQGDQDNLAEDLKEIQRKIQGELDLLRSEVLNCPDADAATLTPLKSVVWSSKDRSWIEQLLSDECPAPPVVLSPISERAGQKNDEPDSGTGSPPPASGANEGTETASSVETVGVTKIPIKVLDDILSQQIKKQVQKCNLLHIGHYQLNTIHCARDWVETKDLIDQSPLTNDILREFSNHIWESFKTEEFTVVGLDLMGAKIAAQIGFLLRKPFTYVIPAHQHSRVDLHEIQVPGIPPNHKIVLVTDSIVTALTVSQVIDANQWGNRVLSVYTVLYRKPKSFQNDEAIQLPCSIYALNTDFPAEIALVSDCPYGNYPNSCRAENKKL